MTKRDDRIKLRLEFGSGKTAAAVKPVMDHLIVEGQDDLSTSNTFQLVDIDFRENADAHLSPEGESKKKFSVKEVAARLANVHVRTTEVLPLIEKVQSERDSSIESPPGSLLKTIFEFVFSKKTLEQVVNPIIADMQEEYFEALAAKRPYKAAWVLVREHWSFVKAVGLYSLLKVVVEMWRKIS